MKTTTLGILTLIAAVVNAVVSYSTTGTLDLAGVATGIASGWGLIHAADASK